MLLKKISIPGILLLLTTLLTIVLGLLVCLTPAALFPDPSWGFQVMRSMEMGGAFNMLIKPDHANLTKNTSEFLTWWSPGQYLVPYFFKSILKINTGQAAAITTAICQLCGLTGLFFFFRKAGFSLLISSLSLVFIACQQAFYAPYIFYNGGEVLLFAFFGWFFYGCIALKPGISLIIFVLLAGLIGFICKSSFIWMYAAGLLFIWIRLSLNNKNPVQWLKNGLLLGVPAVTAVLTIYLFYLSKGANPSSEAGKMNLSLETFSFPVASPLLSAFSADDLANGLLYHNDIPMLSPMTAVIVLCLLAIMSIILVVSILRYVPNKDYRLMIIVFYGVSVIFFTYAFLRGMAISFEARHFRLIGLLITPGIICLVGFFSRIYRVLLATAALVILSFSLIFYTNGYHQLTTEDPHGPSGVAQQFIDREAMDYVTKLDNTYHNAIFVFTSPDLGLDIMHNRIITLQPLNGDIRINFDQYVHHGYGGPLFILLPSRYIGIRASVFMKCFPGYKAFSLKEISDDYVLYYSNTYR